MKSWYTINAKGEDAIEIDLFDEIGAWGIDASQFARDLKAHANAKTISLRINSPGGSVMDGLAIYNLLRQHSAKKTVTVYGIAGSISGIIAMVGDPVVMPENTFLYVHNPMAGLLGYFYAEDLRDYADLIDKESTALVATYKRKTGLDDKKILQLMADETLLTAAEAKELGFADQVADPIKLAAKFGMDSLESNAKLKDLIAKFNSPAAPAPAPQATASAPTPSPIAETPEAIRAEAEKRVKDILDLCTQAGVPDAAASFIDKGMTAEQVKANLADADKIRARCTAARFPDRANGYIKAGMSVEEVADALFDSLVARQGPEIDSHLGPEGERVAPEGAKPVFDSRAIYDRYKPKQQSLHQR